MKTKNIFLLISMISAQKAFAILGVGDVVIVASDPAHELMWATEELPKWTEMISKAETQVQHAQEMIDIVGHPKDFAQQIVDEAKPALALTLDANGLKASSDLLNFTQTSWSLYKSAPQNDKAVLDVPQSFQLFDDTIMRDRSLYTGMAAEKALRGRLQDAITKKHDVDTLELDYQQRTLTSIGTASTQTEIELHQAGLAASRQRMEIAGARVQQAQGELDAFLGDTQLEARKQQVLQAEQSDKFVDAALARATQATMAVAVPPES